MQWPRKSIVHENIYHKCSKLQLQNKRVKIPPITLMAQVGTMASVEAQATFATCKQRCSMQSMPLQKPESVQDFAFSEVDDAKLCSLARCKP